MFKKDKVFIIVMGLVLVNLIWGLAKQVQGVNDYFSSGLANSSGGIFMIGITLANTIAIIGVLMLLRAYRRSRTILNLGSKDDKEK